MPKTYLKKAQLLFYPIVFLARDLVLNFAFFTLGVTLLILTFLTEKISSYIRCRKEHLKNLEITTYSNICQRVRIMNINNNSDNKNENIVDKERLEIEGNNRDESSQENSENCVPTHVNHSENDAFDLETVVEEDPFEGQTMDEVSEIKMLFVIFFI
jgi:hypothetical protein